MADNVGYTPGSGATVAADDIGGVLYQRVKPVVGVDGVAVDVSDDAPLPVADENSGNLLLRILQMLMAPQGYDKSVQRQRVAAVVESGTVTTVTTVTNVTSLNNIDTYNARMTVLDTNRTAWAQCVRARIT
jgi:hypothetical protein